jgi:predicted anti-sigma-YlaC factor YlaD
VADVTHPTEALSALLDGALTAAEMEEVERHLAGCEQCRAERDDVAQVRAAVRSLTVLDPPPGVLAPHGSRSRARRTLTAWAASGIAAAALGIGLIWGPGEPGTTMDLDTLAERHTARVVVDPGISTLRGGLGGR